MPSLFALIELSVFHALRLVLHNRLHLSSRQLRVNWNGGKRLLIIMTFPPWVCQKLKLIKLHALTYCSIKKCMSSVTTLKIVVLCLYMCWVCAMLCFFQIYMHTHTVSIIEHYAGWIPHYDKAEYNRHNVL